MNYSSKLFNLNVKILYSKILVNQSEVKKNVINVKIFKL